MSDKKVSIYEKIDYDIQMRLYQEFNSTIASINEHLGEVYGYSDLKDAEDCEKKYELMYYKGALKEKCDEKQELIVYLKERIEQIDETFMELVPQDVVYPAEMRMEKKIYQEILDRLKEDK